MRRDKPFVSQLMYLTYEHTKRRLQRDNNQDSGPIAVEATGTVLSILEWSRQTTLNLDEDQQLAFQIATAAFVLTYYEDAEGMDPAVAVKPMGGINRAQMRQDFNDEKAKLTALARLQPRQALTMFLDGQGGSGKTRVVKEVLKYGQDYTSRLQVTFDMRTVVVTALSGVAAIGIGGETLHSAASFNRNIPDNDNTWKNARLLIIDEVSFMSTSQLELLNEKLQILLRRPNALYGNIHILFCGDFRQLEPVSGNNLYSPRYGDKTWVNSINCYIQLHGLHRFKEDPEWGRILSRIRMGTSDQTDIDAINKSVIQPGVREVPPDTSYCVYTNADRAAINVGLFAELLKQHWTISGSLPRHMLVVTAGLMKKIPKKRATTKAKSKAKTTALSASNRQYIYEHCSDSRVRVGTKANHGHFVDPLL
ncbi:MAG: AAA family ATPase, partial [Cetobacterium sp.]